MIGAFLGALFTSLLLLLYHLRKANGLSDDCYEYLKLGRGEVAEGPFGRRWLPPLLCGEDERKWKLLTNLSLISISIMLGATFGWVAPVLFLGCTAISRLPIVIPVLVDSPSFAFAFASTLAPFPFNLLLALLSGACKETGPVFAAAWSLNPTLLLGLLAVRWWHKRAPSDKPWLQSPKHLLLLSIPFHPWLGMEKMLFPWGAMALLVPVGLGLGVAWEAPILSLALGYGSLLLARDRTRLYEWAFPALIPAALACPPWLVYPLLLPHLMNPNPEC